MDYFETTVKELSKNRGFDACRIRGRDEWAFICSNCGKRVEAPTRGLLRFICDTLQTSHSCE